jgi:glycosyltransferase involved in cell wall biosynthesis
MEKTIQSKPTVLIICFNYLHKDPRILRQIEWLKDGFQITTIGFSASNVEGVVHIPYAFPKPFSLFGKAKYAIGLFGGLYEDFYWSREKLEIVEKLKDRSFDFIIANDADTLPLAVKLAKPKTKTIFDAHEYAPLEFTESWRWRVMRQPLMKYICREYIPRVTAATTVCRGIAEMYERNYGKKFEIITNATKYEKLKPSLTKDDKIRLIYHGFVHPSRKSHQQIEMMRLLPEKFELNLVLVGDADYIESLKKLAQSQPNIKFLPPVATGEIANFINQFDVGVYSLPPTNFNNKYALPNKFFEFIQARLAVVIAPSPEMARIVREFDLGLVAEDFSPESMAETIKTLTPEKIDRFKTQAHKHAYELSAEKNRERLLRLIESAS